MQPKKELEKTHNEQAENQYEPDKSESPAIVVKNIDQSLKAEILAKRLLILELKDDKDMDIHFLKDESTLAELSMIGSDSESKFMGIIAKCKIDGCDIHMLNNDLEIIKHFHDAEPVDETFQKARDLAQIIDESVIAILVFNTHNILLHVNGSLEVVK